MRFSTSLEFNRSLTNLLNLRTGMDRLQQQVSSGRRIQTAADDPVASSQVLNISERSAAMEQFNRNANLADLRLSDQEAALTAATNTLQRVRELMLSGQNGSLTAADRRYLNAEIRQRLDELLGIANSRNANGEFIFAGTQVTTRPFATDSSGTTTYAGDQNVRELRISESRTVPEGFSGFEAFVQVRNGNGTFVTGLGATNTGSGRLVDDVVTDASAWIAHDYRIVFAPDAKTFDVVDDTTTTTVLSARPFTEGQSIQFNGVSVAIAGAPAAGDQFTIAPSGNQSVFQTVRNVIAAMDTAPASPSQQAALQFGVSRALADLDQAMNRMTDLRTSIGGRQNTITSQISTNSDTVDQLTRVRASLEDVDPVEAISKLAQYSQLLEAAQASFVKVQSLSLFNYLR